MTCLLHLWASLLLALPTGLQGRRFDVVSCLNVLDRCDRPVSLLRDLKNLLQPGTGRVLLALVIPY